MSYALRLDSYAAKVVRRMPELEGKKSIGRGMFSAVFDGSRPDRVWKMTVDSVGYWLLNCCAYGVSGSHFPKLYQTLRDVGEVKVGGVETPIYLYEIERLQKLQAGSLAKKTARSIVDLLDNGFNNSRWSASMRLKGLSEAKGVSRSLRSAFSALCDFTDNYPDAGMDMHMTNFMQRKDGKLVITDPFCDHEVVSRVRHS
jgi:hypothetical protein